MLLVQSTDFSTVYLFVLQVCLSNEVSLFFSYIFLSLRLIKFFTLGFVVVL
jgi:hypothetical protein